MIALQSSGFWFTLWPLLVGVLILVIIILARALIRERRRNRRPVI